MTENKTPEGKEPELIEDEQKTETKPKKKAKTEAPKVIIPDAPKKPKIDNSRFIAKTKAKIEKLEDKKKLSAGKNAPSKDISSLTKKIARLKNMLKELE